ncbi:MAG: ABC-type transport auxiliary lipoprotein family protein [Dongiaceae bacterium]
MAIIKAARRVIAGLAVLAAAMLLPSCGLLPKVQDPVALYTLTPKTTFDESVPKVDWQLVVEEPVAATGLVTPRIALQHTAYTLEYYADSAWTDNAPAMVQTLLIESFEASNSIVAVGREAIGLRPDYILKTDLREFEAIYDGGNPIPEIWVRINAKLVQMPDRKIIASETVSRRVPAASAKFVDIIAAFDGALGKVLKEIVVFTLNAPGKLSAAG